MGKLKKMIKDKKGMSYPLTVALVLALLIALCVLAEFFRLSLSPMGYGMPCRNPLYPWRPPTIMRSMTDSGRGTVAATL